MIPEIVISQFLKELIGAGSNAIKKQLSKSSFAFSSSEKNVERALTSHFQSAFAWCQSVEGIFLSEDKVLSEVYIQLDYFLSLRQSHYSKIEAQKHLIQTVFQRTKKHIAILGEAGMGKTTSMKMIAFKCFTDEGYLKMYQYPIVVLFRKMHIRVSANSDYDQYYLTRHLQSELGLYFKSKNSSGDFIEEIPIAFVKRNIWEFVDNLSCLLILDGFDEIPFALQQIVYTEIEEMSLYFSQSKIVLTSRTANFNYTPSEIQQFEIAPFDGGQITDFAEKWLGEEKGRVFCDQITNSAFFDVAGRPLILSYLINLFNINGKIPDVPKSLYQQVIDILLYKWDSMRALSRESKFSNFDYDNKFIFLSQVCFKLLSMDLIEFSLYQFELIYKSIMDFYPNLPYNRSEEVVDEIRKHTGLIVKSGYDRYMFAHSSLQEYLAANYIAKYNPIGDLERQIMAMPEETAMATTVCSNPSSFLVEVFKIILDIKEERRKYLEIFLNKLHEQKVAFHHSEKLGFYVLLVWSNCFGDSFLTKTPSFIKLLNLQGISESIKLLNAHCYADTQTTSSKNASNPDTLVEIREKRNDLNGYNNPIKGFHSMSVPIYMIKDWNYIKVKFDELV